MKTHPRLTFVAIACAAVSCVLFSISNSGWAQPAKDGAAEKSEKKAPTSKPAPGEKKKINPAQEELQRARDLLKKQEHISARLVESVNVMQFGFTGTGRYLQGPKRRMLYEIEIELANTTGKLQEVCDGDVLYTRHEILPKVARPAVKSGAKDSKEKQQIAATVAPHVTVTRKDVQKIFDVLEKHPQANLYNQWEVDLGLGGLPVLLASLNNTMQFDGLKSETLRGRKVNLIEGSWTKAQQENWISAEQKSKGDRTLPQTVPDFVRLWIDAENGFPHRIVFYKRPPSTETARLMVSLDFLDVTLGQPIDPKVFRFKERPNEEIRVLTEEIIQHLEDAAAAQAAAEEGSGR